MFEDKFDSKLGDGWVWLREHPKAWRIKNGGLEIRVEPGLANNVKNALLCPAPDRSQATYAIEVTITFTAPPTNQYEQAGITWYQKGKPVFKLVHEHVDGKDYMIPGKCLPRRRPCGCGCWSPRTNTPPSSNPMRRASSRRRPREPRTRR